MKDWLSIGQFSKKSGVSARALRIYEEVGLLRSHVRGENGYRYYRVEQLATVARIKYFKNLGFTLGEIRSLLQADEAMDFNLLKSYLKRRLERVIEQQGHLFDQKVQIQSILSSLEQTDPGLDPSERRFIMSHFEKISIVVTGIKDLDKTAKHIEGHLSRAGQKADVLVWNPKAALPNRKPYILIVDENLLQHDEVRAIMPDVVVIKNISEHTPAVENSYANLYTSVGPHMATIFNADDRLSLELAANETIRKGKTYYFSKNSGLESQIQKIGGVVSDGEDVKIFGFNRSPGPLNIKLKDMMGFDEEVALLASLAAVMDVGLNTDEFGCRQ